MNSSLPTVAIDLSRAVNESAGIARYTASITGALLDQTEGAYWLYATYLRGEASKREREATIVGPHRVPVHHYPVPGALKEWLWGTAVSLPDLWSPADSMLFAPSFFELPLGTRRRSVVTIHDVTVALFPQQRGEEVSSRLWKRTQAAVTKADHVITVSQTTKNDLVRLSSIAEEKVTVIPLAAEAIFRPNPAVAREKIVLSVGTLEPRKNLPRVVRAFAALPKTIRSKTRLVIIGALGWNYREILEAIDTDEGVAQITCLGSVSDEELASWYQRATCLVYPSLYEGFGLPPLEAMQSGLPVITSNSSSLPEVVGDAALLVNPADEMEISAALARLLNDPKLRQKLSVAGLRRAQQFSWKKAAAMTVDVLQAASESSAHSS